MEEIKCPSLNEDKGIELRCRDNCPCGFSELDNSNELISTMNFN